LNETYMMTSREVENLGKGVRLVHLYPQSLLIKKVLEGIRTYIILGVMLIIICLIAAVVISLKSTGFLNEFIHAMESVRNRNYDIRIKEYKNAEINSLGRAFNEMMDELRELIRNKYESQILLNEMEIRFLQHQMNPHFLFNVLLTIQIKAKRSGNETIYKMVSKLSALLRASIYTNNVDRITVGEELEYTEFYLYLQKMRFEDRFFYKIIVEDEELKKSIIPKFVIEPIVENAVIHGIENIENEGVIRIVLKKMGTDLLVTVQDNGAGFDVKEYFNSLEQAENGSSREKIGLKNVDLRLRHIYGEEYRIKIKSKINTGTTIYIKIPIEEREENV
jgi:two-component system sensor histidine kinase YesM